MANITVTASTPVVNVSSTNNTVNVSQTTSTVNVSLATGLSQSAIRGYFGNTFPILYDVSTGVYSIDSDAIVDETVVSNGIQSGNVTLDLNAGRMHKVTLNGDVTGLTLANVTSGRSATVIFSQDATGSHALDTTTFPSNWTTWEFANQNTDLDENGTNFTVMSVFYDGSNYYASLVPESAQQISTSDIANLAITTEKLAANAVTNTKIDFTSFNTDNISVGSTNLYFTNALARASVSASGDLSYNSTTGVFSFTNDAGDIESVTAGSGLTGGGASGNVTLDVGAGNGITVNADNVAVDMSVFSTSDLSEGTNLYYTTDRANTAIGAYTGALTNLTGNITTTGVITAGASATDIHNLTGNLNVTGNVEVSGNLNYRNVEDLYVRDQSITLNANAATDATVSIIANRPVAGANTVLRWNETSDVWEFTNDGSTYYPIPTSTSDLAEGTNLYYTNARVDAHLSGGYGITYTGGVIETTNADVRALISATGNINYDAANGIISESLTTTDITEGDNLYYTDARFDTRFGTKSTSDLSEGTNLYYTTDRANTAITTKLLDTTRKDAFNLRVQDLSVSSNAELGTLSYYFPNTSPGSAGQFLLSSDATNLGFSDFTNEANTAIGAYTGAIENLTGNVTTTGNITGGYIIAGNDGGGDGIFIGDINGAIQQEVRNESGDTIAKGKAVYLTGVATGSTPHVALANAENAAHMPAIGIVKNQIPNNENGEIVTNGQMNFTGHGFTVGAQLYINGAGALSETVPVGESNLVQKIGKVVTDQQIIVQGAGRTNATPNLDDGAIFAGNSTNQAVAVDTTTNFDVSDTEFDLSNSLSNVNSIQSESGSNVTLDTAGGIGTNFTKTQGATADTLGLTINPGGYSSVVRKTSPTYAGTANITTFIATGNATSGSPNIVLSAAVELNYQQGGATDFGNATTLSDCLSYLSANMVFRTGSLYDYSLAPFPAGTRISSVDAANNIVTMNNNATADFEFQNLSGLSLPFYRSPNKILFLGQGAYDEDTGIIEQYYSLYDFAYNTDRSTFINTEFGWYANFYNPVNPYTGGYGLDGPTVSDLSLSFTNDGNLSLGTQPVLQKSKLEADSTFLELEDGLVFGGANPTRRMQGGIGDYSPIPGIQMLYSGNESWTDKFNNGSASGDWPTGIYAQPQLQLGLKSFTDNSVQNASPQIGPRLFFSSAKGKLSDSEYTHYPRAGQEIGRLTWWGTHGDDLNPAQNSPPAYMSVQASDDWTAGSNASMYFTGTSNWQGVNTNDLWLAYERGNIILASGQNSGDVSKNAGITFAPAKAVGNNPRNIYDFSGNSATSLQQTFAKVNYANVSANSGAKVSVTHGASIGAGTVGDQVLSISRNDNSYTLIGETETSWNRFYVQGTAGSTGDLVRTNSINTDIIGPQVTFTDVVDANWTFLNGNTYVLRDEGISSGTFHTLYDSSNTSPIIQAGGNTPFGSSPVGTATYNVSVTSGVTDYEYTLELPEQESNLYIKANATTAIKITDTTEVNFTNIPVLPSHSNTSLPAAGTAGGMIYITNGNDKPAYSNGSAWLYVFDNSAVT